MTATASPAAPSGSTTSGALMFSRDPHSLQIEVMRQQSYPGSPLTVEQSLERGANYARYLTSYKSDGNKIYALLTVPDGARPASGWPVIVFVHGFIPPAEYRTTERYIAYVDAFARNGYIVLKTDLRGHGSSEGRPVGGYGVPDYTNDVLNALATMKAYPQADARRIGIWGYSMGGQLALRAIAIQRSVAFFDRYVKSGS